MRLQQLRYLIAVAESGSINSVAHSHYISQSALSTSIRELEEEMGVKVFNRTNKGVALTDEGKKLYQYARTIINQMELIQGLSEKEHAPVLSIASYPIITMGRLMAKFYNNYHDNRVALKLVENRLQQVIESVEHGEAEIGFVMSNNVQVKELKHMLKFKNLQFHALGTDTWYANIGPNHPLYHASEVTMEQLLPHPFVRLPDDYFSNLSFYLEIDGVRLEQFKRVVYVNDSAAILSLLRSTDVVRLGPGLSAPDFAEYGIRTIPIRNCQVQINVGWIQRSREMLSTEAQAFVKMLEELYPKNEK